MNLERYEINVNLNATCEKLVLGPNGLYYTCIHVKQRIICRFILVEAPWRRAVWSEIMYRVDFSVRANGETKMN